jgi:hypothetical protein
MIYYKVAVETTNCLRPCIAYLHRIPQRHDPEFATPALICFFLALCRSYTLGKINIFFCVSFSLLKVEIKTTEIQCNI